jgi:hypothetical protein
MMARLRGDRDGYSARPFRPRASGGASAVLAQHALRARAHSQQARLARGEMRVPRARLCALASGRTFARRRSPVRSRHAPSSPFEVRLRFRGGMTTSNGFCF